MTEPTFCLFEDRTRHLLGLQVAVLTLLRALPEARVVVSLAGAAARSPDTPSLLSEHGVEVLLDEPLGATGWDVKPALLLRRLREGAEEVVWWDSDLAVCCGPQDRLRELLRPRTPATLLAAEDTWWGEAHGSDTRSRGWGLVPVRTFPRGLNTCVLRVGRPHLSLLQRWQKLLQEPGYLAAQRLPGDDRPLHLLGDQEVLAALLGSADFGGTDLQLLRRGRDIAQCWGPAGYRVRERLASLVGGSPALAHAMVTKPWELVENGAFPPPRPARLRGNRAAWETWYDGLHAQLSPYTVAAAKVRGGLSQQPPWLSRTNRLARLMGALPGDPVVVAELPLAVVDTAVRGLRRRRRYGLHAA